MMLRYRLQHDAMLLVAAWCSTIDLNVMLRYRLMHDGTLWVIACCHTICYSTMSCYWILYGEHYGLQHDVMV